MIVVTVFFLGKRLQRVHLLFHVPQRIFQPYIADLGMMLDGPNLFIQNWLQLCFALYLAGGGFIMK